MMSSVLASFPPGYIFSPTDEELLTYYLYHKIMGDFEPPFSLPVIDLYSQEPSEIWQQLGGIDGQDLHFFTKLKRKKSRIIRKVGSNGDTWSGENRATQIFSSANNNLVGTLKRFHYENSKVNVSDDCSWIMYEYTLNPNLISKEMVQDPYVVCKIRKNILRKRKREDSSMKMQIYGQVSKKINQKEVIESEQFWSRNDSEYRLDQNSNNVAQAITRPTTQMELLDQNPNIELTFNKCDDDLEFLKHIDVTCFLEEFSSLNDLQLQTCSTTQMEFLDQNSNHVAQKDLLDQNSNHVAPTYTCPTTEDEVYDPNFDSVEHPSPTTKNEVHDQYFDSVEHPRELEVCNHVESTNIEENVGFDNEWYWNVQ